mmetsp:Transcript_51318/g.155427  ORF Transcript_51318/g.155427 Transcript_51318/m.155427 type:complete len:361 (-) Transcript_51318:1032-2114(-)
MPCKEFEAGHVAAREVERRQVDLRDVEASWHNERACCVEILRQHQSRQVQTRKRDGGTRMLWRPKAHVVPREILNPNIRWHDHHRLRQVDLFGEVELFRNVHSRDVNAWKAHGAPLAEFVLQVRELHVRHFERRRVHCCHIEAIIGYELWHCDLTKVLLRDVQGPEVLRRQKHAREEKLVPMDLREVHLLDVDLRQHDVFVEGDFGNVDLGHVEGRNVNFRQVDLWNCYLWDSYVGEVILGLVLNELVDLSPPVLDVFCASAVCPFLLSALRLLLLLRCIIQVLVHPVEEFCIILPLLCLVLCRHVLWRVLLDVIFPRLHLLDRVEEVFDCVHAFRRLASVRNLLDAVHDPMDAREVVGH